MNGHESSSEGILVLVVDDEPTARFLTRQYLELAHFVVEEASDGQAGLEVFKKSKPAIVVTDVMMPIMNGFTLCEEIRRLPEGEFTPILMVTGLDDLDSIQRAYDVGATDFIAKPFNWLVLSQRVKHMARVRRLTDELQKGERKIRALVNAIPDAMFRMDQEGLILEAKESRDFQFSLPLTSLVGKKIFETMPLATARNLMAASERVLNSLTTETSEYQLMIKGYLHDFEARLVASGENEILVIVRDITERARAEKELRESRERYALATLGANDGLWDWNMRTNEVYYSSRWRSMLGYGEDEIGDSPEEWFGRIHPDDIEQVKILVHAHSEGVTPHFEAEHQILHKDGTYRWVLTRGIAVRDESGMPYRMAGSQTDITDRRRAQDQLLHDAFYDPLTGLPNRSLLINRLEHALRRTKRSKTYLFAILFVDLDRFKNVNDSLGHLCGDRLLIEVGRRLTSCVREEDTVARIGGDEFVILLDNIPSVDAATAAAERIEKTLSMRVSLDGHDVFSPASIGIAVGSSVYERAEDVLRDADIAVYRAKALGRARHVLFDPAMYERAVAVLEMENDLRRAIERNEFFLHYQPIVDLDTGSVVSLETLVRWEHPERGLISPGDFIPLAEETGLIIQIGEWVLRAVCAQLKAWQEDNRTGIRVAVNISGRQLKLPDFPTFVRNLLQYHDLSPDLLEFEITETVLMDNLDHANTILDELTALGIRLSLDDFGTGYSSLSYLQQFPVHRLKIDRSFIIKIGHNSENTQIVQAILNMARGLGLDVVAEGVETAQAAARLKAMDCAFAQGFYFARPGTAKEITALLPHYEPVSRNREIVGALPPAYVR
jgi:diguanylate cyclase (GGDEF)-like protein/PAS domain S-box-containing protein